MTNQLLTHSFGRPFAPNGFLEDPAESPTAIKEAEQNAVRGAMADFYRRTARQAFAIALGLLLLSLGAAAFMGLRTIARSRVNYRAFQSDLSRLAASDENVLEMRSIETGTYSVYLDTAAWSSLSDSEKASYCESFNTAIDGLCHSYRLLNRRENVRIYYYDQDGNLLAIPEEGGLSSVAVQ